MSQSNTVLHLFAGAGGGALGFKRAGFRSVGAFDVDPVACAAHDYLTGDRATVADLAALHPHELRAACTGRPRAVPPPAAEAIARSCLATLAAGRSGGLLLSGEAVWVEERRP